MIGKQHRHLSFCSGNADGSRKLPACLCLLLSAAVLHGAAESSGGELTFSGLPFRLNRDEPVESGMAVIPQTSPDLSQPGEASRERNGSASEPEIILPAVEPEPEPEDGGIVLAVEDERTVAAADASSADEALVQALASYRDRDWASAAIFMRRALLDARNDSAEMRYLLIMSEMLSKDYAAAVGDCNAFLASCADSRLSKNVQYQKGRALHHIGQNDKAVLLLSDFCHQNPDSRMYPSALYWIAECFYEDYNFDTARSLYQQIVDFYPDDRKAVDAKFKLDAIAQREREQKLLSLLRETGEEYLNSRGDYEKQLKEYETEDIVTLRRLLNEANSRIAELEKEAAGASRKEEPPAPPPAEEKLPAQAVPPVTEPASAEPEPVAAEKVAVEELPDLQDYPDDSDIVRLRRRRGISEEELLELKIRAAQLQRLLDERYSASAASDEGEY